jgi:hypothetical protein
VLFYLVVWHDRFAGKGVSVVKKRSRFPSKLFSFGFRLSTVVLYECLAILFSEEAPTAIWVRKKHYLSNNMLRWMYRPMSGDDRPTFQQEIILIGYRIDFHLLIFFSPRNGDHLVGKTARQATSLVTPFRSLESRPMMTTEEILQIIARVHGLIPKMQTIDTRYPATYTVRRFYPSLRDTKNGKRRAMSARLGWQ